MDMLNEIFAKQASLMSKYESIEEENGLLQTKDVPVDINSAKGQARIKDFAWRITEEIVEALDAPDLEKKREEMADALHFLTELSILAGITPETLVPYDTGGDKLSYLCHIGYTGNAPFLVIKFLGRACHRLKNRPWKQTQVIFKREGLEKFQGDIKSAWVAFLDWVRDAGGMSPIDLYNQYMGKSEINKQRQEGGY